ncbi:DeoR family fructose operon transcriptional repressor [Pseudomonas sp. JUb42]|uniref:DeoR/GlpR family DNA-binding transcription regulator n=1 Tax=Pseudomonas sp. JUb42 TaxID=2940611 RepID=UPI00216A52CA|nr:DeoR/GlpR family DNA-binding transcription regulator [Pseudomonas sp. JUb42]MCS3471457.1 DeoR family fructose operon transcriptional repressor [Pseudomonas sp. JUb42]
MTKDERLSLICQHLYSHGESTIQTIADIADASLATVRRDLLSLEADGTIHRTHGGARIAKSAGVEVAFDLRENQNLFAKRAIAEVAYEQIVPGSSIFLDAGTTVLQLARRLRLDPLPLSVFTNCLNVAQVLMNTPGITIVLLGGQLRAENASMVGALAEAMIENLWFDQLFLGAGAIAPDACIYSLDASEAQLNQKMLARAGTTLLLVDSSKFDQRLTYRVAPLSPALTVISDEQLSGKWQARLQELGSPLLKGSAQALAAEDIKA